MAIKAIHKRCGGRWTEARYNAFIKGALRQASNRWPPKLDTKKAAKTAYGVYTCAGFKAAPHSVRAKEVVIDHIDPVVDPSAGFVSWDDTIARMFCEQEGLQVLCKDCHGKKTSYERDIRTKAKRLEKLK